MATLQHDGATLAYDDGGSGPPILFLHGLSSARTTWATVMRPWNSSLTVG